nr:peptide chain release factor N(5)-glutamine methyltransferase [Desulfurispira natronophila]
MLRWSTDYFKDKRVNAPRYSAETLLSMICGFSQRMDIYVQFDRPLEEHELQAYKLLIKRRVAGEPLAYITGTQNFLGLDFSVVKGVLIPRFDTENIAITAVEWLRNKDKDASPHAVLDLCCGTGALGIATVKLSHRQCDLTLADIDPLALDCSRDNGWKHLPQSDLKVIKSNMFECIDHQFDVILCNPPYLTQYEIDQLDGEMTQEPTIALYGGEDGLDFYRILAENYSRYLKPNGCMFVEAGYQQKNQLRDLFGNAWQDEIYDKADRFRGAHISPVY